MRTHLVVAVCVSWAAVAACTTDAEPGGGTGAGAQGGAGAGASAGGKAGRNAGAGRGGGAGTSSGVAGDRMTGDAGEPASGGTGAGGARSTGGGENAGEGGMSSGGGGTGGTAGLGTGGASAGGPPNGGAGSGGAGASCTGTDVVPVSEDDGRSSQAAVAFTGDGYAAVWTDDRDGNSELYFARLDASGRKVGDDVRLTNDAAVSASPSVVWTGTELGVTWYDARDGNTEVYFTRLDEDGARIASSGIADLRVTNDAARSEDPRIVWTGEEYAILWGDTRDGAFQIYFTRVTASGAKRGSDISVAPGASGELAATPNGFGAVWHGAGMNGLQVHFMLLDDTGSPLTADLVLGDPAIRNGNPRIAFDGSSFGVAWQGNPGTGGELQWRRVSAAGVPGAAAVPLSSSGNTARAASVQARPGGGFAVLWSDARSGDQELRFLEFSSNGTPRGSDAPMTSDMADNTGAALTVADNRYGALWLTGATDTTGEVAFRIFCAP